MHIKKSIGLIERFRGKKIKVYYSTGDPVSFSEGYMEDFDADGMLIKSDNVMVFIPWESVVCFEGQPQSSRSGEE
ncbi:hypothetical protein [Ferroplasma sp.]|uniref:hypothetical protein n=1 Tax=Ferroplasma sp. TaxID=2591003 RepID=UPI0026337E65|nr:hypothetical protein [Ferroplasma sp.]